MMWVDYKVYVFKKHVHLACRMCGTPPVTTFLLNKHFFFLHISTKMCRQRMKVCWIGEVENTSMNKTVSAFSETCAVRGKTVDKVVKAPGSTA